MTVFLLNGSANKNDYTFTADKYEQKSGNHSY